MNPRQHMMAYYREQQHQEDLERSRKDCERAMLGDDEYEEQEWEENSFPDYDKDLVDLLGE